LFKSLIIFGTIENTFLIGGEIGKTLILYALKIQLILRHFRSEKIEFPWRLCKLIF